MMAPTTAVAAALGSGSRPGELAGVASIAALALAAVFALTALSKLRSPSSTAEQFAKLELPAPSVLAGAVTAIELITATALVTNPRLGAGLALVLLAAFTAVIIRTIRAGLVVSCGCLGSIDRRPVSWDAVARNGALGVMAVTATATTSLHRPDIAALATTLGFGLVVAVLMQLLALREVIGRIWSVQLAGETGRPDPRRNV